MNRRLLIVYITVATVIWAALIGAFMIDEDLPFAMAAPAAAALVATSVVLSGLLIAALNWANRGDR